jgi:hypothetical protein
MQPWKLDGFPEAVDRWIQVEGIDDDTALIVLILA